MSRNAFIALAMLAAACSFSAGAAFAEGPTLHQVYQAADAGRLSEAQGLMARVLHDHPDSGKAHFVEAELLAKQGQMAGARSELVTAERLAPGLPFAKSAAVRSLRTQLDGAPALHRTGLAALSSSTSPAVAMGAATGGIPWNLLLLGGALLLLFIFVGRLMSRGNRPVASGSGLGYATGSGMPGYGGAPVAPSGGGMGSGILGGLATGAAMGAGIVAGESLMHRLTDTPHTGGASSDAFLPSQPDPGSYDMGGSDFGVSDGGSWDDDSSLSGGTSGDDWT